MTNVFTNTEYNLTEEDRLTNALMATLEHSEPVVLERFLDLCTWHHCNTHSEAPAQFQLQPAFEESRPDAAISTENFIVFIETKRGNTLDPGQFQRHWNHITKTANRPTLLLAITGSHIAPSIIKTMASSAENSIITTRHISWSDILGMLLELEHDFSTTTATGLLINQFTGYLRSLGYWYFDGPPIDRVLDLGFTLNRFYGAHSLQTLPFVISRLDSLGEHLKNVFPRRAPWTTHLWKRAGLFSNNSQGIAYLNHDIKELGETARYRFSLDWTRQGLNLSYYLTLLHTNNHFRNFGKHIIKHRGQLAALEPFDKISFWENNRGFHCRKHIKASNVTAFLNGNNNATQEIASEATSLFASIDNQIDKFLNQTT